MMRRIFVLAALLSLFGCSDSPDNNGTPPGGGGGGYIGTPNSGGGGGGGECETPNVCGNCDLDCKPSGNPFAPGTSTGGGGFDGDACSSDADCKATCGPAGVCTGFGSGGFHGDGCNSNDDCRGICDSTDRCEGHGPGTGYDGDRCTADADCRGACGGAGVCQGDDTGTTPGDGTDQTVCQDLEVNLQHAIPTLVLLIDTSGSTDEAFGGGMNRLQAAYHALMDPTDGLIQDIQSSFRIGMTLYSSFSDNFTCPEIGDVRPELNNYDPLDRVFSQAYPLGGTPTGLSIMETLRQFDVHPDQGRRLLLLATDGEPNTCQNPYEAVGQPEAIAAAQEAQRRGIETIILSIGDAVGRSHLEDMANAGAGLPLGGPTQADYYEANDPTQLKTEMSAIINSARSCIFRVQGGIVDPGLIDRATVTLDGASLTYGAADGWTYHQDRARCEGARQCIELTGAACSSIQDGGTHQILGDFLCTYYDPDNPPIDGGSDGGTIGGGETPGPCASPGQSCEYDGDCCSGVCGAGMCITQ